jgi:hypothetical protein
MFEALIAVTPSETIKTKLVNESMKPNPRFTGLVQGTKEIIKIEGIGGIYRGLFPVVCPLIPPSFFSHRDIHTFTDNSHQKKHPEMRIIIEIASPSF